MGTRRRTLGDVRPAGGCRPSARPRGRGCQSHTRLSSSPSVEVLGSTCPGFSAPKSHLAAQFCPVGQRRSCPGLMPSTFPSPWRERGHGRPPSTSRRTGEEGQQTCAMEGAWAARQARAVHVHCHGLSRVPVRPAQGAHPAKRQPHARIRGPHARQGQLSKLVPLCGFRLWGACTLQHPWGCSTSGRGMVGAERVAASEGPPRGKPLQGCSVHHGTQATSGHPLGGVAVLDST